MISVPSGITQVERRAVQESATEAGARKVYLVAEPVAAALGAGLPVSEPGANLIVDVGGGTTEIAVISLSGIVYSASLRIGGDDMNDSIIAHVRKSHGLLIGERRAEEIKIALGSAYPPADDAATLPVKGRDLTTGLPKSITVTAAEIRDALREPVTAIVEAVRSCLEQTPPELAADIVDQGIMLTGGGALLPGLDKLLSLETELPVSVSDDPLTCVVRGAGRVLDDPRVPGPRRLRALSGARSRAPGLAPRIAPGQAFFFFSIFSSNFSRISSFEASYFWNCSGVRTRWSSASFAALMRLRAPELLERPVRSLDDRVHLLGVLQVDGGDLGRLIGRQREPLLHHLGQGGGALLRGRALQLVRSGRDAVAAIAHEREDERGEDERGRSALHPSLLLCRPAAGRVSTPPARDGAAASRSSHGSRRRPRAFPAAVDCPHRPSRDLASTIARVRSRRPDRRATAPRRAARPTSWCAKEERHDRFTPRTRLGLAALALGALVSGPARPPADPATDAYLRGYAAAVLEREFSVKDAGVQVIDGVVTVSPAGIRPEDRTKVVAALSGIKGVNRVVLAERPATGALAAPRAPRAGPLAAPATPRRPKPDGRLPIGVLPAGLLFDPLLADPRWPSFSAAYQRYVDDQDFRNVFAVSFGETIPIYRDDVPFGGQWEIGLQAGVFSLFDLDSDSFDLINADYFFGIPSAIGAGRSPASSASSTRARTSATSSCCART